MPFSTASVVAKCKAQLLLLDAANEVVAHFDSILGNVRTDADTSRAGQDRGGPGEQAPGTAQVMEEEDIALSREIVDQVLLSSTEGGLTRVVHGPVQSKPATPSTLTFAHLDLVLHAVAKSVVNLSSHT